MLIALLLAKAAEALPKSDRLKEDLNAVARQVQKIDRRIERIMEAMEEGAPPRPLPDRLKQLEDERLTVASRQEELVRQVAAHGVERPDAHAVFLLWQRWGELWEIADEDQRSVLLASVVGRVEMQTKTSGVCDLALLPQTPLEFPPVSLEPTGHLGAGAEVIADRFPLLVLETPLLSPDHMRGLSQRLAVTR